MSNTPQTPDGWRKLLNSALSDPELSEEAHHRSRRQRRRARKAARIAQRRRTRQAIDAERRRHPITVGGAALILAVIAALGLGSQWLTGDGDGQAATQADSASPAATQTTTQDPQSSPTDSPSLPSASATEDDEPDLSDPERVAEQWARAYLSRNPPEDGDHTASVERAEPWMTSALARNLANHDDPEWDDLVSQGGVSEVTTVDLRQSGDDLPADNPVRIWRHATITAEVDGYTDYTETYELDIEVTQQDTGDWLVSRVLGLQ